MSFKVLLQYLIPHHFISRLVAKLANSRTKWIKNLFIDYFTKTYCIDLQEAIETNPHNYATFNDFFTRQLKPGMRPIAQEPTAIVSPVDGKIFQIGKITANQTITAKGCNFTLTQLLGNEADAAKFANGHFAVIYLAPCDYHRIHMPASGTLQSMTYIPGRLFSVSPAIVNTIDNVFARNERVVNIFNHNNGPMGVILVGAMIVGSIETSWAGTVTPNKDNVIKTWNYNDKNISLDKGAELGHFKLGSTVILLFPENAMQWDTALQVNSAVRMGHTIGHFTSW